MSGYRDDSRKDWGNHEDPNGSRSLNEINTGAFLRIADAVEVMSKNNATLKADRDWYERMWDRERERSFKLKRRNAALRGVITKMKKEREGGDNAEG